MSSLPENLRFRGSAITESNSLNNIRLETDAEKVKRLTSECRRYQQIANELAQKVESDRFYRNGSDTLKNLLTDTAKVANEGVEKVKFYEAAIRELRHRLLENNLPCDFCGGEVSISGPNKNVTDRLLIQIRELQDSQHKNNEKLTLLKIENNDLREKYQIIQVDNQNLQERVAGLEIVDIPRENAKDAEILKLKAEIDFFTRKEAEKKKEETEMISQIQKLNEQNEKLQRDNTEVLEMNRNWQHYDRQRNDYLDSLQINRQMPNQYPMLSAYTLTNRETELRTELEQMQINLTDALKTLKQCQDQNVHLEEQLRIYREDFQQERREKDEALTKLQSLTKRTPAQTFQDMSDITQLSNYQRYQEQLTSTQQRSTPISLPATTQLHQRGNPVARQVLFTEGVDEVDSSPSDLIVNRSDIHL